MDLIGSDCIDMFRGFIADGCFNFFQSLYLHETLALPTYVPMYNARLRTYIILYHINEIHHETHISYTIISVCIYMYACTYTHSYVYGHLVAMCR